MDVQEALARAMFRAEADVYSEDPWEEAGEEMHAAYLATADAIIEELERAGYILARPEALFAQLPDVDPDSPDLSDLRAWCLAMKRFGGVTDEESERLLQMAKRVATVPESELTAAELKAKRRVDALMKAVREAAERGAEAK